ncbi:T9SS type A sorting domain-containing protein [Fluviicola taffensis]|uniref:T9SS type A sorting domain-containing protein n=1 Tax=Fluviicola taffensis TaxID=191579 RepID=UPI003137DB88
MKKLLLSIALTLGGFSFSHAQCSVQVNDSLLSTYDYVLNAVNATGSAPFVYSWTVTDGNGIPVPYTTSPGGDSVTIDAATLQNNYGCVIYQLCVSDMLGCTSCSSDTAMVQVPFPCYSAFNSSIVGPNQVSITLNSSMPPFMIMNQMIMWTDGTGQGQSSPYMGPGTLVTYTPGASNSSNKFFCCILTNTPNGGCISCDSIQYTNSALGIHELEKMKLHIAPNPASSITKIESASAIETLKLVNSLGQSVSVNYSIENNAAWINLSELPKGVYIVQVATQAGTFKEIVIKE